MLDGSMNALWLLLGLLVGAALVAAVLLPRLRALTVQADQAGELERELVRSRADLEHERSRAEERLATVNDAQQRLSDSFKALSADALQSSMAQLAELARAQMQTAQTQAKGELDKRQQGGAHVVVDARAPLQGVLDAYQARDEPERERHLRDHARLLRKHVKGLAEKTYWAGLDSTPDFVVMFLPGEHLYGAALDADPALIEDAMARRVLIATPTTLLAMLRAVAYGWQQERVAESAQEISDLGRELHGRLVKLSGLLATLGTRLNSAVRAYNETVGSYEARVLPSARRFSDHGAVAEGREMPPLEHVTTSARAVHAAELELEFETEVSADEVTARRLRAAE